jgi:lipid II:glycine glycyltransferase (peptidoglycan interpeptide bridge formation enzyme)
VIHAQYIATSIRGQEIAALDAVFEHCIRIAANEGRRWFDFGISNENAMSDLNQGLYQFKSEFGGGGMVHEFFRLNLRDSCR